LHSRGILHGDLYAHNILVNDQGHSFLGDFGAASFYNPADKVLGQSLERLEVRAFGCLLEDLLDHCPALAPTLEASQQAAIQPLRHLQQMCMSPDLSLRPSLTAIGATLAEVAQGLS
ncbi:MAG TPA: lipopolysaccharide kinase InaA family protein, partial [Trichocoleus sp.]